MRTRVETKMPNVQLQIDQRGQDRIARLTIDNERKLNTLNTPLMEDFVRAIESLSSDETLRALIVTGGGDKAFIGGADIDEMAALDASTAEAFITRIHRCCDALRDLPVPVIARIQGYALGGGLELAAACDLRIAADTAILGMPEVKLGMPSVIEAALLPPLVGWGRARHMLLLGENFTAAEAAAWGLVELVVPKPALDQAIERWIASILQAGPRAIRLQKKLIRAWEDLPLRDAIRAGIHAYSAAWQTDEPALRLKEFQARRRPRS
ncbi:MAG: enoyl-CoA hydratase/isomerase family protein [Acidobacteriia bacterium]|nr:enoyl-CoA hydratase/isomerase family protein [Terriglobia bacterium]